MAFWKKITQKLVNIAKRKGFFSDTSDRAVSIFSNTLTNRDITSIYSNWVFACVRAIANAIAEVEVKVFKIKSDQTVEEIFDNELLTLLENPNPDMSGFEFKNFIISHLELTGNAYIYLPEVKNEKSVPQELYLLNPLEVTKQMTKELPIKVLGYKVKGKKELLTPFQVIHLKYPNPFNQYEGKSTVSGITDWILEDFFSAKYNQAFFSNGAKLSGLLKPSTIMNEEQIKLLRDSFLQNYTGQDNAYSVAALPPGVDYQEMGQNRAEMQFSETQSITRDKILAGMQVPKTVLGVAESETNRATAETANYVFALRNLRPKLKLIASMLNKTLAPRFGADIYVEFEDPVPENRDQKILELQAATASQPVISVNEARELYFGLGAVSGNADNVMTDFTHVPLGKPISKNKTSHERRISKTINSQNRHLLEKNKMIDNAVDAITEALDDHVQNTIIKTKELPDMPEEKFEIVWKAFISRLIPYQKALASKLREFNAEQQKEVLDNLQTLTKTKALDITDLFNISKNSQLFVNFILPVLNDLYKSEGQETNDLLSVDTFTFTNEEQEAVKKATELLAQSYNETTAQLLIDQVEQGLENGESYQSISDRITTIYDGNNSTKAEVIAQTEAVRIGNLATKEAYKKSGFVESIKWYTAVDERVCEFCKPLNAKTIGVQEKFFDKGEEYEGEQGGTLNLDYSDVEAPPIHPSCRCYIRPEKISVNF